MTSLWRYLWPTYDTLDLKIKIMCKIVVGEGNASLVVIPVIIEKISQENERGLEIAPQRGAG